MNTASAEHEADERSPPRRSRARAGRARAIRAAGCRLPLHADLPFAMCHDPAPLDSSRRCGFGYPARRPPATRPRWSALRARIAAAARREKRQAGDQIWQTDGRCAGTARGARNSRCGIVGRVGIVRRRTSTLSRRIAIVEDEPAHPRQLRGRAAPPRLRGRDVRATAPDALAAFRTRLPDLALSTSASATTSTAASRCAASCARCRRRVPIIFLSARDSDFDIVAGPAPRRRRLPDQGREPAAPRRAHRRAVPAQRAPGGAAGDRGHRRARPAHARRQAPDRATGTASASTSR